MNGQDLAVLGYIHRVSVSYIFSRFKKDEFQKVKKVAVDKFGNDGHYFALAFLKNQGFDLSKLDIIAVMDDNAKLAMLKSGQLDMALMTSFKDTDEASKDFTVFPFSEEATLTGYNYSRAMLANKEALQTKKDAVRNFEKAIYETLDYIKNHRDESIQFAMKDLSLESPQATMFYEGFVQGLKNEKFVLDINSLDGIKKIVIDQMKPKDTNRNLDGLNFPDFTKEIVNTYPDLAQ